MLRSIGIRFVLAAMLATVARPMQLRVPEMSFPLPPPPHVDHETVAMYSAQGDMEGLHKALLFAFKQSARVQGEDKVQLREILTARGAGFTYTSAYKMEHDIQQLEYIMNKTSDLEHKQWLMTSVLPKYHALLAKIPPLSELSRTAGLFAFPFAPKETEEIAPYYNRAVHVPDFPPLERHLHPDLDTTKIERDYFAAKPSVAVVDNALSPEALQRIRDVLAESTVWYETKMPERFGGYVGAYLNDGLHQRVLLALAQELREALPNILGKHPLRHLWAYKYDERYTGINVHADEAAVNLNFWITNEDANLNKESGGLVVYTKKPPADWTFEQYNQLAEGGVAHELLQASGWQNVTIPYRENRLVMFDSALFHKTDSFQFRPGYLNRRINLTLLFGEMDLGGGTCEVPP
mmetsp:Transcript_23895/g.59010  ORF Transcript_23895/g.59010 Transcript_23895/m.59010 type:complete len:407 (-) Transcript_23895:98-1318(-)